MKTHLPKGLRAALMAALASVSITTAYGVAPLIEGQYAVDWTKVTLTDKGQITGNNSPGVFCPTVLAQASHYNGSQTSIDHINVVRTESKYKTGDIYFDVINAQHTDSRSIVGVAQTGTTTANIYTRIGNAQSDHLINVVVGVDSDVNLNGNVYMELADSKATYRYSVAGSRSSITGSSTLVIRAGTFNERVAAGFSEAEKAGCKIGKGTYLQIEGGTFNADVMGGTLPISNTATIEGGSHLLINGGTFNKNVYGGSGGIYGVVNDGVDITVSGGTFNANSNIYALGAYGKVSGAVNLTIGNDAEFASNSVISAGANGNNVNYSGVTSSTVMLYQLTDTSSLASDSSIKVMGMGGQQGSTLNMRQVKGTINAQLSQFSAMRLSWESDLTLRQATNATLGGVSSVTIHNASTLSLQNDAGQNWDLSGVKLSTGTDDARLGTLKKTGAGKLTIGDISDFGGGAINVQGGELSLSGSTAAKYLTVAQGATLSVKEGDLFTGDAGAGSSISVNGATLAANEGNWTLNKAATIDGVTITGTHEVSFGSEVNSDAVVTMSGTIDATGGHLVVKNGATSGETTLTGHFTIENTIQNGGALTIANGSYIGINEESLKNCLLSDGKDHFSEGQNGFLYADTLVLASGGTGITLQGTQILRFDGKDDADLVLEVKDGQLLMHMHGEAATEYFVNEGTKSYSEIVTHAAGKTMDKIALDGGTLNLDTALAEDVTILAATDHASVSVGTGIELYAGQTAVVAEGSVNELRVTGEGSVRIDAASADKLSQLSGDATMKVDTNTTFSSEAKMTGALEVGVKEGESSTTLTVSEAGKIASFKSVDLADNTTLESQVADTDSIQALNGSGTLSKTGEGKLAVKDASGFTGEINASAGTLELEGVDLTGAKVPQKVSVSNGATVNLINVNQGADGATIELSIDGGTFGVYADDQALDANKVGNLTLAEGGKIVVGMTGSTLEANLVTLSGSVLDFTSGGQLTMGCTLDVQEGTIVLLSEDKFDGLKNGTLESVTLFNDIDNTSMDAANVIICRGAAEGAEYLTAQVDFHTDGQGNGTLSVKSIPEPATGTLSLLALAGLCARRRRK